VEGCKESIKMVLQLGDNIALFQIARDIIAHATLVLCRITDINIICRFK
jgi:hypothetical protein